MKNSRRKRTLGRRSMLVCESLENRVVLTSTGASTSLLGSLSYVGVVTSSVVSTTVPIPPMLPPISLPPVAASATTTSMPVSKLGTDLQTLRVELESLASKSGVTIADLQSLTNDSQAIAQVGFTFGTKSLNPVISELAIAVAGGTSTSQAQSDFTALFSGSKVSTTTINGTLTDLEQTIKDSAVTTSDLSTVAADEAAIQADLKAIPVAAVQATQVWLDQVGTTPGDLSLSPAITTPTAGVSSTTLPPTTLPPITLPPIIISPFGNNTLSGALSTVGVVTSPVTVFPKVTLPPTTLPPTPVTPTTLPPTTLPPVPVGGNSSGAGMHSCAPTS